MDTDSILQQLIIRLRMDGVQLTKSTEAINKDLDKLESKTGGTQKSLKKLATDTNKFGKEGAAAFAAVRREALGYFALVTGGLGMKSFLSTVTQANVAVENLSKQLGIAPQRLMQFRYALNYVGSDSRGIENMLATIQSLSTRTGGIGKLGNIASQMGVKLRNEDGSVRSDIPDQLHDSAKFQRLSRGQQKSLIEEIGGNEGILNLVDSKDYRSTMDSFKDVGATDEQMAKSRQFWQDIVKLQAENAKILNRVYSDLEPFADGAVRALTALEKTSPETVARGLEILAGAITVLGGAVITSPLVKVGKALGLGKAAKFLSSGLKAGIKGAPRLAGGAVAAEAAEAGAGAVTASGPGGWAAAFIGAVLSFVGYEGYQHVKAVRDGVDWTGDKIDNAISPIVQADNMARIQNTLERGGLSKTEISGILANIQIESKFNPNAVPPNGEPAYGLMQWHPSRQKEFAKVFGHDIRQSTIEEQAKFILYEKTHAEKAAFERIERAKTAYEAGYETSLLYVRPRDKQGQAMKRAALAEHISEHIYGGSSKTSDQTNHLTVNVGDINVTSHSANPTHVAHEVHENIGSHLQKASRKLIPQNTGGVY